MKITKPNFDETEIEYLRECLESGWVTQGPFVNRFEEHMKARHRVKHGLAVTSCTAGLHIASMALGLAPGDEVLVPAFTWITSANAAEYVGARAVLVDVDPRTFNIDPAAAAAAVTPNTRAIVAVHLFGLAADMNPLVELARKHDLKVIEDAACAVGTHYRGTPVGGLGDIAAFSFHPRKAVTTGEGGLVSTNDDQLARTVDALRNHGSIGPAPGTGEERKPWTMARFSLLGYNYRMSDIQAAVGVAQMEKLDRILDARATRAHRYLELLEALENDLQLPRSPYAEDGHTYQSFVIRLRSGGRDRRNRLMEAFAARGIETRPGTHAVHQLDYYVDKYGLDTNDHPNAATCADTTITLPLSPDMTEDEQRQVVAVLSDNLATRRAHS